MNKIPFDIGTAASYPDPWYVEHPDSDLAIFQNDFKYSMNIWNKFCLWFYREFFPYRVYWMQKENIQKNLHVKFTISNIDNYDHYIGWVWVDEKKN